MEDLQLLLRAILSVRFSGAAPRRVASREQFMVMLLVELPYSRRRLESLLMGYGPELLAVFTAARDTVALVEVSSPNFLSHS
jgi:hypothetical protein